MFIYRSPLIDYIAILFGETYKIADIENKFLNENIAGIIKKKKSIISYGHRSSIQMQRCKSLESAWIA